MYFQYVLGLIRPGHRRPVFHVHPHEPQSIEDWNADGLDLLIDEGRRQLDAQNAMLGSVRGRAQWLVTIAVTILVVTASTQHIVWTSGCRILHVLWVATILCVGYGTLGSAAILTVRLEYGTIDATKMSGYGGDRKRELAAAYTSVVRTGANTNATILTLFWQSVLWVLGGGALGLIVWLVARR